MDKIKLEKLLDLLDVEAENEIPNFFVFIPNLKKLILEKKLREKRLKEEYKKSNAIYKKTQAEAKKQFFCQTKGWNFPIAEAYAINPVTKELLYKKSNDNA